MEEYHEHDVLCGRGRKTYKHPGNIAYRRLVMSKKDLYFASKKIEKIRIAKKVVDTVHLQTPPGRFLEYDQEFHIWKEITYSRAVEKTSQALRERETNRIFSKIKLESKADLNLIQLYSQKFMKHSCESKKFDYEASLKGFGNSPSYSNQSPMKDLINKNSTKSSLITEHIRACLLFEKSLQESCQDLGVREEELNSLIYQTFVRTETHDYENVENSDTKMLTFTSLIENKSYSNHTA